MLTKWHTSLLVRMSRTRVCHVRHSRAGSSQEPKHSGSGPASETPLIEASDGHDPFYNPFAKYDQAYLQTSTGKIFDKKPFRHFCTEGKTYLWCACGYSKDQPFCDKICKVGQLRISERPVQFVAPATKKYWFCNCKQTGNKPFCDGTHQSEFVQSAVK
ncbi:unnamed protein product [Notodromas monacha]|uniref:Iron-binding zinc finger CDGSH type domain-containing protein n=1 Tax=Notodromas monacha TaxID=399045 RepID=A0A7R9BLJ4_9CRUS|nr:unnamed protein product [Notodromas monacha]CAG0917712.1 unnamed protein product [Notodromas monacha]